MHIGIVLFDDVELLDMAGPYEVFTTAARLHARAGALAERTARQMDFDWSENA